MDYKFTKRHFLLKPERFRTSQSKFAVTFTPFKKPSFQNLKKLAFWFRLVVIFLLKSKKTLIFYFIILAIFVTAGRFLIPKLPVFRNELAIGMVGEYNLDKLPKGISQLYSAGLTKVDKDGQIIGDLAKSWETQDGKKFQFSLKDDIRWQDGDKLKTSDINFELPNVVIRLLDDKTIEFELTEVFAPFPQLLTEPVFKNQSLTGTGVYKIDKIFKDNPSQVLKQLKLAPLAKNLPQITIHFFPNSQKAALAFKTGQVGLIFNLGKLNGLEGWKGAKIIESVDNNRLIGVFYNTKDTLLENEKVRKALDLSIDRSKFKNPTIAPYPANSWVSFQSQSSFDIERAAKLLKEANVNSGQISILTPQTFEDLADQIAANWQQLGFEVKLEKIDKIPQNFQVAIFGLEIPADPDQYSFWHSTQSHQLTKIENPKLDKLLEDGRKAIKIEERKAIYQELQRELVKTVPASFLFFQDRNIIINNNSRGELEQIQKLFPEFPVN